VEFKTETFIDKPYAKAYYKKLNEAYHAGLIDRSTFTMSYDQYIAAISNGTVLGMFDQAWDFGTATSALTDAQKYDRTYVALGLVYDPAYVNGAEIEEHYLNGSLPNVRRGFGISTTCKCPERIIAMWEKMLSPEWALLMNWGIEGEDYSVVDGRLTMSAEQFANTTDNEWRKANKAYAIWESSPKRQGYIPEGEFEGQCWEPANQPEIVFGLMNDYDKDFLSHYGYEKFADFVNPAIELAPYGEAWQINKDPINKDYQDFLNIQDTQLPQVIMADESEFDAKWDAFVAEIKPYADAFADYMQGAVIEEANKVLQNAD
jgi:putative aldouronate transport system substrate-binding protein